MSEESLTGEPSLRFRVGTREYLIPLDAVAEITPGARPRLHWRGCANGSCWAP